MARLILLPVFLFLAACGAQPTPLMFGAVRMDVVRDGRNYVIYQKGELVEVIRLGWAAPGQHQGIRATMIALIPEITGCRLRETSLTGDSGEMRAKVTCPRAKPG